MKNVKAPDKPSVPWYEVMRINHAILPLVFTQNLLMVQKFPPHIAQPLFPEAHHLYGLLCSRVVSVPD